MFCRPVEDENPEARRAAEEAASKAAISKAFEKVTKESAQAADEHMEKAYAHFQKALDMLPDQEKNKELTKLKPMAEQMPGDPESEMPSIKANIIINIGNAHYEHSILRAAGGLEWKSVIQRSKDLFEEAGAADVDIRNALKGHPMSEEMKEMIGPDPDEKKAAAPKGLPSLGPRKKKESN